MRLDRRVGVIGLALVVLAHLALGCAGPGGKTTVKALSKEERETTLMGLIENWEDYEIYSDGPVDKTAGVIFDPKDDERHLTGAQYVKVRNQRNVETAVHWVGSFVTFNPKLYRILDDQGNFYGYYFVAGYTPVPERVDAQTLKIPKNESPFFVP